MLRVIRPGAGEDRRSSTRSKKVWSWGQIPPSSPIHGGFTMETKILAIILGAVLPVYPVLFMIHQRIGSYDEVVEEFRRLQDEHGHMKEVNHGN
jgi:hypothetical protein